MGYDLNNSKSNFRFNVNAWPILLELAFHYGWNRLGTTAKDKGYLNNDSSVTPEDAINLAIALEKALSDIPEINDPSLSASVWGSNIHSGNANFEKTFEDSKNYMNPPSGQDVSKLLLRFSGDEHRQKIKDFIDFCKKGEGFDIQ